MGSKDHCNALRMGVGLLFVLCAFGHSISAQFQRVPLSVSDVKKAKPASVKKNPQASSLAVTTMPGAQISVSPTLGGKIVRENAAFNGVAIFAGLDPGQYLVSASLDGFETAEIDNVTIPPNKALAIDLELKKITFGLVVKTNAPSGEIVYTLSKFVAVDKDSGVVTSEEVSEVSSLVKIKNGRAKLPYMDKGHYDLDIRAPGYETILTAIRVPDDLDSDSSTQLPTFEIDLKKTEAAIRGAGIIAQAVKSAVKGKYYALIIGNNDYEDQPKLQTAIGDAKKIHKILQTEYGFEAKLLLNATRGQMLDSINSFEEILTPEDSLLIFYAGHGYDDKERNSMYWLPVDALKKNRSMANWISSDDILTNLRPSKAKHLLIIADSCFGGMLVRGEDKKSQVEKADRQAYLVKMLDNSSKRLIASGRDTPVADGGGNGHSIFARRLIDGLSSTVDDQFTADELFFNYLRVTKPKEGQRPAMEDQTAQYDKLPNFGDQGGEFVFIRKKP